MSNRLPQLIPGATTDDGVVTVTAPYDGAVLAAITAADGDSVETALATASMALRWLGCLATIFMAVGR